METEAVAEDRGHTPTDPGAKDRREALRILAGLIALTIVVGVAVFFVWPELQAFSAEHLTPGLGLKPAFVWGFGVTFAVFVVFAVVSGDGLIGELPVMLGAFLAFWMIFSVAIAWIF